MNQPAKSTIPQFVTAPVDDTGAPQTIKKIAALDAYLVQFNDGKGEEGVRIVFKVPGSDAVFIMRDNTGGTRIISNSTGWFRDQFNKMLTEKGSVNEPGNGESGEDGVGAL